MADIESLRRKAKEGTLTEEELKEGIAFLRQGRKSACFASKEAKKKVVGKKKLSAAEIAENMKEGKLC